MKNVLVLAHEDAGQEARLACAIDIVRALDGHLDCLEVTIPPPLSSAATPLGAQELVLEVERESRNRVHVRERLGRAQIRFTWREALGRADDALIASAWLTDLVVASCPGEDRTESRSDVTARLIEESRQPLMLVPHHAKGIDLDAGALVAWDGSPASEAALRAAIPLLAFGASAIILCVDSPLGESTAREAAAYCARHDVSAEVVISRSHDFTVAQRIVEEAELHEKGWIVAGGYGHSRLREALFGGVTRGLLAATAVPLFMVHRP
jgi:nucleotide-binding universal stress UspA family protein